MEEKSLKVLGDNIVYCIDYITDSIKILIGYPPMDVKPHTITITI